MLPSLESLRRPCPPGVILLLSVKSGDLARTSYLLRSGINPDLTKDAQGNSALHIAALHGHTAIARVLLSAGASTELATPAERLTPLRLAAECGHLETAQVLLDAGADVSTRDLIDRATPLHSAAEAGHVSLVLELVRRGADLESRAVSGQTPLRWALSLGRTQAAAALLRVGADPNAPDRRGACCLHVVAGFFGLGAEVDCEDAEEEERDVYYDNSNTKFPSSPEKWLPASMAELLLSAGAAPDCVHRSGEDSGGSYSACNNDHGGSCGRGSTRGSDICTGQCVIKETPLHVAARECSTQVARVLLRSGADPNARTTVEEDCFSPLHCAAAPGSRARRRIMVRVLLEAGADMNAVAADGVTTPLRLACLNAAVGCVEELLCWGASDIALGAPSPPLPTPLSCSVAISLFPGVPESYVIPAITAVAASAPATAALAPATAAPAPATAATAQQQSRTPGGGAAFFYSSPSLTPSNSSAGGSRAAAFSVADNEESGILNANYVPVPSSHFFATQRLLPRQKPSPRPLWGLVGSRVPLSAKDPMDCQDIREMLRRAPLDRAWRRRGWLVMLYERIATEASTPQGIGKSFRSLCSGIDGESSFLASAKSKKMFQVSSVPNIDNNLGREVRDEKLGVVVATKSTIAANYAPRCNIKEGGVRPFQFSTIRSPITIKDGDVRPFKYYVTRNHVKRETMEDKTVGTDFCLAQWYPSSCSTVPCREQGRKRASMRDISTKISLNSSRKVTRIKSCIRPSEVWLSLCPARVKTEEFSENPGGFCSSSTKYSAVDLMIENEDKSTLEQLSETVDRLFKVQGDQSVLRCVIEWL